MKRKHFAYPYIVWMVLFIVVPMVFILYYAVNVDGTFTLRKFIETLSDPQKWQVLWLSVKMAFVTTLICLLLGYPIAYILSNLRKTVAGFISVLFFVPMWMNFVLRTYAWQAILEYAIPNLFGWNSKTLTGTVGAVLMVLVYNFIPFMVMPLYNTLAKLDKSLLEAARDLGANGIMTFFRVVLPLSVPGIVSGITSDYCKVKIFKLVSYTVFQCCQVKGWIWISVYLAGFFGFDGYRASGYRYSCFSLNRFVAIQTCLKFHNRRSICHIPVLR